MVRSTSRAAYAAMEESGVLSRARLEVWRVLAEHGPLTRSEADQIIGRGQSYTNVSARLTELREMGYVEEVGKRICRVSHNNVILWNVTDKPPTKVALQKKLGAKKWARMWKAAAKVHRAEAKRKPKPRSGPTAFYIQGDLPIERFWK